MTAARIARRDIAIAGVMSVLGVLLMVENVLRLTDDAPPGPDEQAAIQFGGLLAVGFAIPLFVLVTVPLLWRRSAPVPALAAAAAALGVNAALVGSDFVRCGVVIPTGLLLVFAAAAQSDGRTALTGLGLGLVLVGGDTVMEFGVVDSAVPLAAVVATWGVGRFTHSRRRLADELRARTAELRAARDDRARLEVAADRARLSRDLDRLLHRRLGELARMAGGARPHDAAAATSAFARIEHASRRTLDEMRAAVGVLRSDTDETAIAPQPTLTHLDALLVRAKGADARLSVEGNPRVLPAAVELSAYRIVEQLLEALDDAPDVEVRVRFGDEALELAVSGPAGRRAQAAIERARERARLQQGTLEATLRGGRAEAVASLPVLATVG